MLKVFFLATRLFHLILFGVSTASIQFIIWLLNNHIFINRIIYATLSTAWCCHAMWFSLQHIGWKVENYEFPEWNTINHWSFEKINPGAKLRHTICKIFTDSLSIHGVAHNSPTLQLSVSATPGLQDHHHQHQHQKWMKRSPTKRFSSESFF